MSLNAAQTILTFVELVADRLQACDVDFLDNVFGNCSYGADEVMDISLHQVTLPGLV